MKLFYVQNVRIPTEKAHGIQIMKMCEAFALHNNIDVTLIVPKRFNKLKKDPFEYYRIKGNFKITKLPCLDLIVLDKYIGHLGLWMESFTFFLFLLPYILFQKANIVYTRDKFCLSLSLLKKNLIFEAHTFPKNYFLYSPFFKKFKKIIVITQRLKNLFTERGISADKILVASDGVDLKMFGCPDVRMFEARGKLDLPQDKKIVLYTGHLYAWKGADTLLEAARNFQFSIATLRGVPSGSSNFQFIFIGGTTKDVGSFREKAKDLNNVRIVGHRPHAEIPYWLKAADVLVLPNSGKEEISRYWTSPLKMFEYMASKRPIVASDINSLREILNENNAVLVEPDNPKKLTEGIKKILENKKLAEKISARAHQDVQNYTWEKRAKKILDFATV